MNEDDVHSRALCLREGFVAKVREVNLEGVVEIDEVDVVAGHQGNPAASQTLAAWGGAGGSREHRPAALWQRTSRPSLD